MFLVFYLFYFIRCVLNGRPTPHTAVDELQRFVAQNLKLTHFLRSPSFFHLQQRLQDNKMNTCERNIQEVNIFTSVCSGDEWIIGDYRRTSCLLQLEQIRFLLNTFPGRCEGIIIFGSRFNLSFCLNKTKNPKSSIIFFIFTFKKYIFRGIVKKTNRNHWFCQDVAILYFEV